MRGLYLLVVVCLFELAVSKVVGKEQISSSPLNPLQVPRFVEEEHDRIRNEATTVVSALKEHEIISVFGHIWDSADANQRTEFSNAFGAKIKKADDQSQIRFPSTTPTIVSDFESLYHRVSPTRRVEFVKKTLWDQLPSVTQSNLLSFIGLESHSGSRSSSSSKSESRLGADPIRVWTSGGSDFSLYDACGDCDDWMVCETSTGPNVCITPCTQHEDCFALFDAVRGRQYNGGCDSSEKQCVGFKQQARIAGTLPAPQVQKFRDWALGRGVVVDKIGVVTDWGPNWKKTATNANGQLINSMGQVVSSISETGSSEATMWTWSGIALIVMVFVNLIY